MSKLLEAMKAAAFDTLVPGVFQTALGISNPVTGTTSPLGQLQSQAGQVLLPLGTAAVAEKQPILQNLNTSHMLPKNTDVTGLNLPNFSGNVKFGGAAASGFSLPFVIIAAVVIIVIWRPITSFFTTKRRRR